MKFELDDSTVLKLAGTIGIANGVYLYAQPKEAQDVFLGTDSAHSEPLARWLGLSNAATGAQTLTVGFTEGSKEAKKDLLKVAGYTALAVAAQSAYLAADKQMKAEPAYTMAAVNLGLAGLALWRGYKEDDE